MNNTFFITGTDTGIGKTFVTCILMQFIKFHHKKVIGMKPIAAGVDIKKGETANEDVNLLKYESSLKLKVGEINTYSFDEPMAPHIAAQKHNIEIDFKKIKDSNYSNYFSVDLKETFQRAGKFNKETLPLPNQTTIEFREEPAKTVAAITFGGWANDEKIEKYKQKLKSALEAKEIPYTNRFFFLGYNPPYEIFNRKNEIIVELKREAID